MKSHSVQAPSAVVLIRPHHFFPNPQTAVDNSFQVNEAGSSPQAVARAAFQEASDVITTLEARGVRVHVFEDETDQTPDSVFPNNWFSTHPGGHVAIYPMFAANRRKERRYDVIEMLKQKYRVQEVIDYSGLEPDGLFLEGTGAMVLDHIERIAYAIRSNRTDPVLLERFCTQFNYEPMVFEARDRKGVAVYHTNVLMCIATDFAAISLAMVADTKRRAEIARRLEESGREIIDLSEEQIAHFAGNMMEIRGKDGRILALSQTTYDVLDSAQIRNIENYIPLVPLNIPSIEKAGGSVRCMLAGIHLSSR
ncbi:arginine deiminase-related protein [Kiloniella laminariae]|uniref:Arginine deiminase-related protein n=1 Tax=Kiloniella laminariae TaxID=454162 RepID=A0ABT4LMU2_9PROT|nr:arginine deiminase-related protein [Kiloniella laminariae]MCZ4282389.1 arginine deiminase-related protein [Kiloniella laminariae]